MRNLFRILSVRGSDPTTRRQDEVSRKAADRRRRERGQAPIRTEAELIERKS